MSGRVRVCFHQMHTLHSSPGCDKLHPVLGYPHAVFVTVARVCVDHFNLWSMLGWRLQICGQYNTLTCAVKTSGVWVPCSTWCAYCGHIPNWVKTWVTPEPYLSPLSCVWIWHNGTTPRNSGIATVGWREKHHVFQPRLGNSLLVMLPHGYHMH